MQAVNAVNAVNSAVKVARVPAKAAMAQRRHVTFGEAYVRDLLAGVQRDLNKHVSFAIALGVASQRKAQTMSAELLQKKLVAAVAVIPPEQMPHRGIYVEHA